MCNICTRQSLSFFAATRKLFARASSADLVFCHVQNGGREKAANSLRLVAPNCNCIGR